MTEHQEQAGWNVAEWHGKLLVDLNREKVGKLQDVYVDTPAYEHDCESANHSPSHSSWYARNGKHLRFARRKWM